MAVKSQAWDSLRTCHLGQRRQCWMAALMGLVSLGVSAVANSPIPPQSVVELRTRVAQILEETRTAGAALALVGKDGPIWVSGVGYADAEVQRIVTPSTIFPIGSVSKMFVSLSVLKLQEEGKIDLNDRVRIRAPDVYFANRWEATDPVRIVNLLEHTAGWGDNTPEESRFDIEEGVNGRRELVHPSRSRVSRWQPGTCFSYSNVGPAVAAYIVGRATGGSFKDYVRRNWFEPLNMVGATYGDDGEGADRTNCYDANGEKIRPHIGPFLEPAGGVWASAGDMVNLLEFFLQRGTHLGVRLLPTAAIDRMERPTTTYAARAGLEIGYGLSCAATVDGTWIWRGHGGAVPGALCNLLYLDKERVGYAVMINSENPAAMARIELLVRAFLLRGSTPTVPVLGTTSGPAFTGASGWYHPVTPRDESSQYLQRILGLTHLRLHNSELTTEDLTNGQRKYVAVGSGLYRRTVNAVPTAALVQLGNGDKLLQFAGGPTFRRLPNWWAALLLGLGSIMVLLMVACPVLAFIGRSRESAARLIYTDRTLLKAWLGALVVSILIWNCSGDYYARANGPLWSGPISGVLIVVAEIMLFVYALRSLVAALAAWGFAVYRSIWWHWLMLSLGLAVAGAYLLVGSIGQLN